jgi:excinuclease ABC subunit C
MTKGQDRFESIYRQIKSFPTGPGLYFMKSTGDKVLYIGKAKNLRSRVASYFQPGGDVISSRGPKIAEMISKVKSVDFLETPNEVEAVLAEARLIKDIRPPYNTDLVDDKTFPYLEITSGDDFPGVYMTRKPQPDSRLFGPFAGAKDLRQALAVLQKIFRFRTCRLEIREDDPKRKFFRPCILYSIKQCTAPCANKISKSEYKKIVIGDLIKFLCSKRSTILRQLKKQMAQAAEALEYEKAAMFRDRIRLIERLDRRGTPYEDVQPEVFAADPTEALAQLRELLQTPEPVRIIEGIDAASISGAEAVGSLVKFIDGRPFKSGYRRFKIKTVKGIDDYAMIAEVVKRRYKYALRGEELWPDLVLIDGGLGHLNAAETALKDLLTAERRGTSDEGFILRSSPRPSFACRGELPPSAVLRRAGREGGQVGAATENGRATRLAAIAKREEEIYLQGSTKPLKLSRHSPVLKLLQYIRDEAHLFAQHYHHILRRKKMLNEKP